MASVSMKMDQVKQYHIFKSSSSTSLHFPPPHQLGLSSGIHPYHSYSSRSNLTAQPPLFVRGHALGLIGRSTPDRGNSSLSTPLFGGKDEVDFQGGPPAKRKKIIKPVHVKTFDERSLNELVLYLPPRIPSSILHSKMALSDFVITTAVTYVSLWDLAKDLQVLNLRFPAQYVEKLSEDSQFLSVFLQNVFEQLGKVNSIEELLLPTVTLHPQTNLALLLQPIVSSRFSITHLFLPMSSSLHEYNLKQFDLKAIATLLRKMNIKDLTLISSDDMVEVFADMLSSELKQYNRKNTPTVTYSSHDLGAPGPNYIAEMDEPFVCGEAIDPLSLVSSLNAASDNSGDLVAYRASQKSAKQKARRAFSTDCTYTDEAELSTDGPFVSEIWNLDRLHEKGINGSGTTIAVIDSGINYMHPSFKGKILAVKNFVKEEIDDIDCAIDSDGHGTHCAGIAAGNSHFCPVNTHDPDSLCIRIPPGVAPGAKLVVCKVVKTSNGDVDSDAFHASLEWLKQQHVSGELRIDVVSISLASTYHSHERAQVISDLTSLGVIVVCCASNVGRLRLQPIAFPARLGHVLCIGAHDENGKPTSFSPVGRELDFLAPGDNLWGPGPGTVGPFAMDCASGTSCATPGVAGLVCLILQAVTEICASDKEEYQIGGKPLIEHIRNVWVMREILKEMSSSPGHHAEEIGYGTLNPYRILDRSHEEIMRIINEIVEDE